MSPSPSTTAIAAQARRRTISERVADLVQSAEQFGDTQTSPGPVQLLPQEALVSNFYCGGTRISAIDSNFNLRYWVQQRPTGQDHRWHGEEIRNDSSGREWSRSFNAVIDNFGNLVEVTA